MKPFVTKKVEPKVAVEDYRKLTAAIAYKTERYVNKILLLSNMLHSLYSSLENCELLHTFLIL